MKRVIAKQPNLLKFLINFFGKKIGSEESFGKVGKMIEYNKKRLSDSLHVVKISQKKFQLTVIADNFSGFIFQKRSFFTFLQKMKQTDIYHIFPVKRLAQVCFLRGKKTCIEKHKATQKKVRSLLHFRLSLSYLFDLFFLIKPTYKRSTNSRHECTSSF